MLLQSSGFASPKDAGQAIGQLQQNPETALANLNQHVALGDGVSDSELSTALATLQAELLEKAKSKG